MRPPLCFELKLLIITGYEHFAEFDISDVADKLHTLYLLNLLVIADRKQVVTFMFSSSAITAVW